MLLNVVWNGMDCVMNVPYEPLTSRGVNVITTVLLRSSVPYVIFFVTRRRRYLKLKMIPR